MEKRKLRERKQARPIDEAFVRLMTYRAAVHSGMCDDGKKYEDIPEKVRAMFALMEYREVVRCLIVRDHARGYSVVRMAMNYRLTYAQVRYIVENFAK